MEEYRLALITKIEELRNNPSPLARSRINILLKLLGEIPTPSNE